ncbi:MAG TPA: thioredoxin domain-containing protein, partial [Candidatus Thermoplasmatota archaeon]|nr:thioredoxin domain-containing protein [Candidatus Thermoplasmatota archaeon]
TSLLGEFDAENGGFGGAPKFPHPGAHAFLLARVRRTRDPAVWNALDVTLTQMGNGGIYDQVGGGFHRYSVDAHWVVPHFEKMLYDNGELLKNYVHAHQATGREDFLAKARDIAQWMEEVLVVPGGGFGASQDADVGPHDDGDYFTWTQAEARAVLDDEEFHLATLHWDIEQRGEMHHNPAKNVLFVAAPAEALSEALSMPLPKVRETLASARRKLRAARAARTAPYVDPTLYANWNGMAITGFLDLAGATGEARYRDVALAALDRFLQTAYAPDRGFAHQVSGDRANVWGLLDDNVQLSDALLTAFNHTQDARHLETAATVGNLLLDRFFDAERGALRDTARGLHATDGVPVLEAAEHPAFDQPTPAPNAVAVLVFDRLARLTGDARYRDAGDRILKGFATDAGQHGVFAGTLLYAMELQANPAPDVLILGPVSDARTQALHAAALAAHAPNATVRRVDPRAPPANLPEEARARLQAVRAGEVAALVCEGFQCSAPLADPKALRERLTRPGSTA